MIRRLMALLFAVVLTAVPIPVGAQEDDEKPADPGVFLLTEAERERVLTLFHSTGKEVDARGRVSLRYHFQSRDIDLASDWMPAISKKNRTVRMAKDWEGAQDGTDGILIADTGQWFHKAVFAPDVKFDLTFMSLCGGAKNDMVSAVFAWKKLKSRIGCNLGEQIIRLSGTQSAGGIGKGPLISFEEQVDFGFILKDEVFRATKRGSVKHEASGNKFLKKLEPGHVGLVWRGTISAAIPEVTIEGQLDLDWIADQVPEVKKRLAEWRKEQKKKEAG